MTADTLRTAVVARLRDTATTCRGIASESPDDEDIRLWNLHIARLLEGEAAFVETLEVVG